VVWISLLCAPIVAAGVWAGIATLKEDEAQTAEPQIKGVLPAAARPTAPESRQATQAAQKIGASSRPQVGVPEANQNSTGLGSLIAPTGITPGSADLTPIVPAPDDLSIGVQPANP